MSDQEKIKFLEFMILNLGDQLGFNMKEFGRNETTYLEDGKELFHKMIDEISRLQNYDK